MLHKISSSVHNGQADGKEKYIAQLKEWDVVLPMLIELLKQGEFTINDSALQYELN